MLALAVERPDEPNLLESTRRELLGSHHQVRFASTAAGDRGKFENLNALLAENPPAEHDWLLVVDDDARNVFALTSKLERWGMVVLRAENGRQAMEVLRGTPGVDLVLMDIMMPEMDGYETTQKIRREHKNSLLPIIAVTAKAMKGDRQKCIEAGASDYITKPLKIDQLLSLMRVWFYK